jgi:hypothetical protein
MKATSSLPVHPSLSGTKFKQFTTSLPGSLKTISMVSSHLRVGLPSDLLSGRITIFVGIKIIFCNNCLFYLKYT